MTEASILTSTILLLSVVSSCLSFFCNHIPPHGLEAPRTPLEDEFQIVMSNINRTDYFQSYMPRTNYMLTIESGESQGPAHKFTSFFLIVSNKNDTLDSGTLIVIDETLSKYSEKCENAIIETAKLPKESVSVIWRSPIEDSGCVRIRALVVETPETWYMEDDDTNEKLSILMCPNPKAEEDEQGEILDKCCACDEAKYEVAFEGLWSRNTHPKDFPSKAWLARFSDVIGASHTAKYRFWSYDGMASDGLKQVAEHGSTRVLESELKDQSEHIRTIIKARGISYPNVTGKTFAVFRVDRKHHLMSLVSMIDPSPDWFVGVSGLELCLSNCSWIEHKQYNLYPYDAGTDEGITYLADDVPTIPQQPIRRITTSYPNDSGSPFYDPFNSDMKPMAKLYINRQRIYEKVCEDMPQKPSISGVPHKKEKNSNELSARDAAILNSKECELEQWTSWSGCSGTCSPAVQTRSRNFIHKKHRKHCKNVSKPPPLEQNRNCDGLPPCQRCEEEPCEEKCPNSRFSTWSIWTPCSASCGPGVRLRSRLIEKNWNNVGEEAQDSVDDEDDLQECTFQQAKCTAKIASCDFTKEEARDICFEPKDSGTCDANIIRFYYDKEAGDCKHFSYSGCEGTRNNFPTMRDCRDVCDGVQIQDGGTSQLEFNGIQTGSQVIEATEEYRGKTDCEVSEWSKWTECLACRDYTYSVREIMTMPRNGGKKCPKKLARKKKCSKSAACSIRSGMNIRRRSRDEESLVKEYDEDFSAESVDCKVNQWSRWSRCTATCGESVQHRTRMFTVRPQKNGKLCPPLVEFRNCSKPKCSENF